MVRYTGVNAPEGWRLCVSEMVRYTGVNAPEGWRLCVSPGNYTQT
ncbi:hypothetical protein ACE1CI_20245 [Aerosakkonemataceae cyanobacterium BLCC-F50]|uniref:Uncharacterized protein n=1 Tax=Floridaenema flaviceps BLCC-F50 TaxID=3153642 RepID=A0ABV4XU92_9CYAN